MAIDLKSICVSAVATVFSVAQSIQDAGVFSHVTAGTYDPTTGADPSSNANTSVNALFGMFDQREIDGTNVQSGDKKLFIKQTELTTPPQRKDYYTDSDGVRWDVFMVGIEPTESVWILGIRSHRT